MVAESFIESTLLCFQWTFYSVCYHNISQRMDVLTSFLCNTRVHFTRKINRDDGTLESKWVYQSPYQVFYDTFSRAFSTAANLFSFKWNVANDSIRTFHDQPRLSTRLFRWSFSSTCFIFSLQRQCFSIKSSSVSRNQQKFPNYLKLSFSIWFLILWLWLLLYSLLTLTFKR